MKLYVLCFVNGEGIDRIHEEAFTDENEARETMKEFNANITNDWQGWILREVNADIKLPNRFQMHK